MNKAKFTPGPWYWDGKFLGSESRLILMNRVRQIGDKEDAANASLIAAAPDLYDALQELAAWYSAHLLDTGASKADINVDGALCQAKAALAKARGESP